MGSCLGAAMEGQLFSVCINLSSKFIRISFVTAIEMATTLVTYLYVLVITKAMCGRQDFAIFNDGTSTMRAENASSLLLACPDANNEGK